MPYSKPDIFEYLDYRLYLKDAFEALKAAAPRLSYRSFAAHAGFTSPNFLQQVIKGTRPLNSTHLVAAAKAFKLNKQETEFFQYLVGYGQARSADEKNLFYQKVLRNKRYVSIRTLDKRQYDFFSQWYVPVVRELLVHPDGMGDSAWIADRIFPRVSVSQVEKAKELLLQLGLARREEEGGRWLIVDAVVRTESEATNLAFRNYHMSAIQLAHDAVKQFPPTERDIRSVTIGLTEAGYADLKARMEMVWKDVLEFAGSQREVDRVYQVNLQVFPLVKERKN